MVCNSIIKYTMQYNKMELFMQLYVKTSWEIKYSLTIFSLHIHNIDREPLVIVFYT